MRRAMVSVVLALVLVGLCSITADAAKGRALSMRMLEKTLRERSSKQALKLCGITRLQGFIVDSGARDIILVGSVDPTYPTLHADDLVVAFRSAHMVYVQRKGNVRYFTPPGCSIDPDPKVLQQLRQVGRGAGSGDDRRQAVNREWEAVGKQPQKVRVLGVPFDSRFAKVMVDADYFMKSLSNGSVDLEIPGFVSLMSLGADQLKEALATGVQPNDMDHALNRFWFSPGEATYEENDGLVRLRECQVRLLTEEEFLTSMSEVKGKGKSSKLAQQFADAFTAKYSEISEARPVYKELQALFRFVAIANLVKEQKAISRSGHQFSYLLTNHKVQNVPVSRTLPGQTRIVEITEESQRQSGAAIRSLTLMSCGGVSMDVRARKVAPARQASAVVTAKPSGGGTVKADAPGTKKPAQDGAKSVTRPAQSLRKSVLTSRTSRSALSWDFPEMD